MEPAFLDTNVILHYLLRDNEPRAERCLELLEKAEKEEIILYTTDLVIAEIVSVLESPSTYNLPKDRIRDLLMPIILLPGLRLTDKRPYVLPGLRLTDKSLYQRIFDLYVNQGIDFIDAYNAIHMEKWRLTQICSYDSAFDTISGITRFEP